MNGAPPVYSESSHPTQIYEALAYLVVFGITMYMYWKTDAKDRKGLITGVGILIIFLFRFFIEFIKNVQVDSEIAMRENTGLVLGQWLSVPFIIWGVWMIWFALSHKPEKAVTPHQSDLNRKKAKKK
jgi:prolipoprotein diacylglyceryltransferase